ncbi:MAG: hypothetical protein RLZZ175_2670 [Bacteroidota bacterium]|jgi:excinuclease ABC subunit C
MKTNNEYLKDLIKKMPHSPGVYKYFNAENEIIYIGKAKNLHKRVADYFLEKYTHSYKTAQLVKQIADIQFVVVNTELDALLLENNLIKENQPKYNILLKDDKTYPYICVTNEAFPRVISTRKFEKRLGTFYGPYTSGKTIKTFFELFQSLFTIRTCTLNLSDANIALEKFKICLEYHIGNCKGPCEGLQSHDDYVQEISLIKNILAGNTKLATDYFYQILNEASANLEFEKAHRIKQKIDILENYQNRSLIVNSTIDNLSVFVVYSQEKKSYVSYMRINGGKMVETQVYSTTKVLDESDEEILQSAIIQQHGLNFDIDLIITNIPVSISEKGQTIVPKIGDKKKLIDLSIKNIFEYIKARTISFEENKKEITSLVELKNTLSLKDLPVHIECFDNSNIQGTNPVSAMVCFKNAKPSKKDYRHYNVKTVVGPNDFDTMYEVVSRRYKRLVEEEKPLPQLIVIDGGKGQLNRAADALKDVGVYDKVALISIAKRLEEIYVVGDEFPIMFSKKSEALKVLQHMRDEAHRFGITFHRDQRSKQVEKKSSILDEIKGIGEKTKTLIQKEYKTVTKMMQLPEAEVIATIGHSKYMIIKKHLEGK